MVFTSYYILLYSPLSLHGLRKRKRGSWEISSSSTNLASCLQHGSFTLHLVVKVFHWASDTCHLPIPYLTVPSWLTIEESFPVIFSVTITQGSLFEYWYCTVWSFEITIETHLWLHLWEFPEKFNWMGKPSFECGDIILWTSFSDWIERRQQAEYQHSHFSASWPGSMWPAAPCSCWPLFPSTVDYMPSHHEPKSALPCLHCCCQDVVTAVSQITNASPNSITLWLWTPWEQNDGVTITKNGAWERGCCENEANTF